MKHIAIVSLFASLLAAQTPSPAKPAPSMELAKIIAVEEQERDLAKAEAMYREAIAGTTLSREAKGMACLRLVDLLFRLGRREEAKPFIAKAMELDGTTLEAFDNSSEPQPKQDPEREKALREKARELVQKALAQVPGGPSVENGSGVFGVLDTQLRSQLIWVGATAAPEIAAALAVERNALPPKGETNQKNSRREAIAGLAGVMWELGTEEAAGHLDALRKTEDADFRTLLVRHAFEVREPRMLKFAERWLQTESDDGVSEALLMSRSPNTGGPPFVGRMDADTVLDVVAKRSARLKEVVLQQFTYFLPEKPSVLGKLLAIAQEFLAGTDPARGQMAQQFLCRKPAQSTVAGFELLLEQLPHLIGAMNPENAPLPEAWTMAVAGQNDRAVRVEIARQLWPKLLAAAKACAPKSNGRSWLQQHMYGCAKVLDATIVPDVLALSSAGYADIEFAWLLRGKVTPTNATAVFGMYDGLGSNQQQRLLDCIEQSDLPATLFEPLRDRANTAMATQLSRGEPFVTSIARTGNPDAATWILQFDPKKDGLVTDALLLLGRRSQDEKVRTALRATAKTVVKVIPEWGTKLRLALLSMSDMPTLDALAAEGQWDQLVPHPHDEEKHLTNPVLYLVHRDPKPPHGFSREQIIGAIQRMKVRQLAWDPAKWQCERIDSPMLAAIATHMLGLTLDDGHADVLANHQGAWAQVVLERAGSEGAASSLGDWGRSMLTAPAPQTRRAMLRALDLQHVQRWRAEVDANLNGEDANCCIAAAMLLQRHGLLTDLAPLLRSKETRVREFAVREFRAYVSLTFEQAVECARDASATVRTECAALLGSSLRKDAVPELLRLLADPDQGVRNTAAEALTKIRFYHEQQAHWDRVLKGLDATPANAAEKLLLQAKPDAPKNQRLLAITSLGTLGVPEALPFLIDWTADPDAEIQKAAKDAITQIHLNPRK